MPKMMGKTVQQTKHFLREERGAIAVEASLYFMVFFLLCALLVDFSAVFLNKSYMERVTNSLASVVRERSLFYSQREALSQQDADQLYDLAGVLLEDSRLANKPYQLTIRAVFFKPAGTPTEKVILNTQSFSRGKVSCSGTPSVSGPQITALSPWDAKGRWLPVYQVTLCVPGGESLFKRVLNNVGVKIGDISISNVVIPR